MSGSTFPSPTFEPPASATPSRARGLGWGTIFAGCALGCLGLVVLLAAVGFAAVRWATRASPIPAEDALLGPEVHGYVTATADLSDPATGRFFDLLIGKRPRQNPAFARKAFPLRFLGALSGEEPKWVGVLSFSRYANLIRLGFLPARWADKRNKGIAQHRGVMILRDDTGNSPVSVSLVRSSLVFGSDLDAVRAAIDHLLDRDGGRPRPELQSLWPGASTAPIKGATTNERGEVPHAFAWFVAHVLDRPEALTDAVRASLARATGAVLTARAGSPQPASIEGSVEIPFPAGAEAERAALVAAGPGLNEALRAKGVAATVETKVAGERVVVTFRLDGVADALEGRSVKVGPVEVK